MSSNYSTIQQHEPLRVPSSWGTQEKRLVAQLEEILDDIYRRFGRLRIDDLGKDLRKFVSDTEGNFTEIEEDIGQLTVTVGGKASAIEFNALKSQVDNQEIGGRNLLEDSEKDRDSARFLSVYVKDTLEDHVGEDICVSFEIKGETARDFIVYPYQERGISISERHTFTMPTADFVRYSFVTKVKDWGTSGVGTTNGAIAWYDSTGAQNYTVRKIKIELGNMPTDWSPAPEDPVETVDNTSVRIDPDGVTMKGGKMDFLAGSEFKIRSGGTFNVFATSDDSVIKFGGTEADPNFSLGQGGEVKAAKVTTDELVINGGGPFIEADGSSLPLSKVIVADTEPQNVHGVLWLKPSGSTGTVDFVCNSGGADMTNWNASQNLTCAIQGSALTGGSFAYGCRFSIYIYGTACYLDNITVQMQRADGTGSVHTLYTHTYNRTTDIKMLRPGDSLTIDTLANPVTINDNLTGGNIKMIVSWQKSDANGDPVNSGAHFAAGQNTIVRCSGTGSVTAMTCDVKYIP